MSEPKRYGAMGAAKAPEWIRDIPMRMTPEQQLAAAQSRIAELEATIAGLLACQEFSKTRIAELEVQLSRERSTCAEMIESALATPGKP